MTNQSVGHVGDVLGHGEVVGQLLLLQLRGRHRVVEEGEQVSKVGVIGALQQLVGQLPGDRSPPGPHPIRGRNQALDQLLGQRDVVSPGPLLGRRAHHGGALALADEADLRQPALIG